MSWIEYIKQEFAVIKAAPVSCLFVIAIGFGIGALYYGQRLDLVHQQNENYQRALGISAPYSGVYADLSNDDLKATTTRAVGNLRALQFEYQRRKNEIRALSGKIDGDKFNKALISLDEQVSEEYVNKYRSEAMTFDTELRHRLSPQALATIVGSGPALDPNISILNLVSGQIGTFGIELTADELEQMNNKLPPDKRHWWLWPSILVLSSIFVLSVFWAIHSGVRVVRIRDSQSLPPSQV